MLTSEDLTKLPHERALLEFFLVFLLRKLMKREEKTKEDGFKISACFGQFDKRWKINIKCITNAKDFRKRRIRNKIEAKAQFSE